MRPLNREFPPYLAPVPHDEDAIRVALGLQGGGSWGAWTAGVLKVLVPAIYTRGTLTAASGTSAGAMNGAALVSGLNSGGPYEGVRQVVRLWDGIKGYGKMMGGVQSGLSHIFGGKAGTWPNMPKPYFNMLAAMTALTPAPLIGGATHLLSHELRTLIPDLGVLQNGPTQLFTNTVRTHIFTGQSDHIIHTGSDLTWDSIVCSAALKDMGAHIIRDRSDIMGQFNELFYIYHDGAYKINPALTPLLDPQNFTNETMPTDLIVISLHAQKKALAEPDGADAKHKLYQGEIHMDMTTIALDDGRRINVHAIEMDAPDEWDNTSRLNTSPDFIDLLMRQGEDFAHQWLAQNGESLGVESSYRPHQDTVQKLSAMGVHF